MNIESVKEVEKSPAKKRPSDLESRINALLTPQQIKEFHEKGYILLENVLTPEELKKAQAAYWRIHQKCVDDVYPHYRTFNQLSDYHIYGIEQMFHPTIFEPDLFRAAINSSVLAKSQQLLGTQDTFMALNRIQCTQNLSYSGFWHRDGDPGQMSHVQSGIYLYPETRFYMIPGSHNRQDTALENKVITENRWRGDLPGQERLSAPAGSMMLFHSSVIHRASCVGRLPYNRAYLHFRIGNINIARNMERVLEEYVNRPEVLAVADANWNRMFTRTDIAPPEEVGNIVYRPKVDKSFKEKIKKAIAWAGYYGFCWIPEGSWFFARFRRFVPYLWPTRGFEIK